ncbi:MAG: hypothetical protein ACE37E_00475 [Hyphomicrobiales bacterium]
MIKKIACTMALALAMSSAQIPAAMADDRPFVAKLFQAMTYADNVIRYRTTDRERIRQEQAREREERQRNQPIGGAGIRG